ncbi:MAG: YdiU family protein [Thiotrichaceae bacterium]|nr:YdiU family protein [Thiotrichaceae bacterium]
MITIPFNNSYIKLGDAFFTNTLPTKVAKPECIQFNRLLAEDLGLDNAGLDSLEGVEFFAGNLIPDNMESIAMAYAGHQFGGFNPSLGDGRAILLGEIMAGGQRYDLQLKGSGPTPYSRSGDGRSALGPVLREYLLSETMAKYGVPTTRALAAVTTGEQVHRMQLLSGGILTRVAMSFVRIGTFQYFSGRGDTASVGKLAHYIIDRHYPKVKLATDPMVALLSEVVDRQARLIAHWMSLGFIHGVMNTDNVSIVGETIDYGPCAFMDSFSHSQVYSSIDHQGRYAYGQQPPIGLWNLTRLAECLLPLFKSKDTDTAVAIAQETLMQFQALYEKYWLIAMCQKLGLAHSKEGDKELIERLLQLMEQDEVDFTLCFYYLSQENKDDFQALFTDSLALEKWLQQWQQRLSHEANSQKARALMAKFNPVYIPRNHQVEAAIRAAEDHNDFSVFQQLLDVLQNPYTLQEGKDHYLQPPKPEEIVHQTFCGT